MTLQVSDIQSEQLRVLREILKWIRFTGTKEVKNVLIAALDTDQKKIIYQLSNGENSAREIASQTGISHTTVRNYWGAWTRTSIVEAVKAGTGERYRHSFDLEDFGIEVPSIPKRAEETEGAAQQTLGAPPEQEAGKG